MNRAASDLRPMTAEQRGKPLDRSGSIVGARVIARVPESVIAQMQTQGQLYDFIAANPWVRCAR